MHDEDGEIPEIRECPGRSPPQERGGARLPRRSRALAARRSVQFKMRGGPFGPPGMGRGFAGRGPRVRRGDVRAAILDLLAEGQPWNGYQLIQEIGARTQGVWRPSAGSVYPALQQLEDEGLITAGGRRGPAAELHADRGGPRVRRGARGRAQGVLGRRDRQRGRRRVPAARPVRQVMMATMQVAQAGSPAQVQQASKILADTRKALYRILAADDEEAGEDTQE